MKQLFSLTFILLLSGCDSPAYVYCDFTASSQGTNSSIQSSACWGTENDFLNKSRALDWCEDTVDDYLSKNYSNYERTLIIETISISYNSCS